MSEDEKDSKRTPEQRAAAAALAAELVTLQKLADEENKGRSGKGTRVKVGSTRGKNPKAITWESFNLDLPETLPSDAAEFLSLTKTTDDKLFTSYCLDGFNSAMYSNASDVLSEYVEANWPPELVVNFKKAVNGYASSTGVSLEDAVSVIKPGVVKAFDARMAASA